MRDDQAGGLVERQLRQGHHGLQQFAHVGHRQGRQDIQANLRQCLAVRVSKA